MLTTNQIADTVFLNGRIYTVNEARSWAEAVAVHGGRIVYVGDTAGAGNFIGDASTVIDLDGRLMLPGFIDSHVHLSSGGIQENECSLVKYRGKDEVLTALHAHVQGQGERASGWIMGSGWNICHIPDPHKSELDAISRDRPIFLNCNDGHAAWVNSEALRLAGITNDTPDPQAGEIQRDPNTGEATGLLFDYAGQMVKDVIPELTPEQKIEGLKTGIALAHGFGITSVIEPGLDEAMLAPYLDLEQRGEMTIRLRGALSPINWQPGAFGDEIFEFVDRHCRFQSELIRVDSVKMYIDGVIEYGSAVLLEPYLFDDLNAHSKPFYSQEDLNRYISWLDSQDIQVHLHAIGDGGVRMGLDAFEAARASNGATDNRHQMCHLELIHPQDVQRFGELDVLPTFQPYWAFEDGYKPFTRKVLGEERLQSEEFVLGSVHRKGGRLTGGSDWFVTTLNPLDAIAVGVRRMDPELADGEAEIFNAAERVDLADMVAAYTINGAFAMHLDQELGSIERGKSADLIVLDRNLFEIPAAEIGRARVTCTYFRGQEVFSRDSDQ